MRKPQDDLERRLLSQGYDLDQLEKDSPFWPAGYEESVLAAEFKNPSQLPAAEAVAGGSSITSEKGGRG